MISTPWIKQGLKTVDIFFIRDHDVILLDDLLIRHRFDREYTERTHFRTLIEGQIFPVESHSTRIKPAWDH